MFEKRIINIMVLWTFAMSVCIPSFAISLEEVNASQGAKVEQSLSENYQQQDRPKTSEEFGIPSVTFKEVKSSKGVVVVFVWAPWCQPCIKSGVSLIKQFESDNSGKFVLKAYNADLKDPDAPALKNIPVALFYKDGTLVKSIMVLPGSMEYMKNVLSGLVETSVNTSESSNELGNNADKNIPAVLEKVTDDNFNEWVASNKVFAVLLGAKTCPSCVAVEPLVTEMAAKYKGKAKIVKYDCGVSKKKMYEYNLSSYPAVLIFKDGNYSKLLHGKNEISLQLENEIIKALQ